ncbi:endonuclease I [Chromobacterium haemolyticum]|uniref:endonuclease I n=1 Tax=Chromobacterium haemolyticum TaxID=394935 RepID=UPI0009D97CED|nr:endonuclease I [Chromobacterium haemolyticum]OQS44845.1 endonuclease I [Chromobacterium haemolyticum]PTU68611.1 endonuclease I [Chromobacterium haemolyticum]
MAGSFFNRKGGWSKHNKGEYRSGLEDAICTSLESKAIPVVYEAFYLDYTIPESGHKYTPDFILPNGIIIESKGRFMPEDRKKHLLIKAQYPDIDIRFVFSNPNAKLYTGSPTSYAAWCAKEGFQFAKKEIPIDWIKEPKKALHPALKEKKSKKG